MKTVAIIQARTGSTRLPGKVLRNLHGKPMLARQIERIQRSQYIDTIVIATTTKPEDDGVAELAHALGVAVFRGSELDVLDRYYQAAKEVTADVVVRITGDCPLHDPNVIDDVIVRFLAPDEPIDYLGTPVNYPEGLDTEVFTFASLEKSWKNATLPSEREHVTRYIQNHPERFVVSTWTKGATDYSTMHWSVDTEMDFVFVEKVYSRLYRDDEVFHTEEVLGLLAAHPDLLDINRGRSGYEGLEKSLSEDKVFLNKNI